MRACLIVPFVLFVGFGCGHERPNWRGKQAAAGPEQPMQANSSPKLRKLTPAEEQVMVRKGTERAFSGKYLDHKGDGTYHCKRCNNPLFASGAMFDSRSGWPSFDDALPGGVEERADADGSRVEIVCARCKGHLGHVFRGEGFTDSQTRHCVNSVALDFGPQGAAKTAGASGRAEAFFAGGCFWGVEYYFDKAPGVLTAESGYMGGSADKASYDHVKKGTSGHAEAVRVVYDPSKTSYEALARLFFEIHDPTQVNRQGPDVGTQYRSAVFYQTEQERATVKKLIDELAAKGVKAATRIEGGATFHRAEEFHQGWYDRKGSLPNCHVRVPRFGDPSQAPRS